MIQVPSSTTEIKLLPPDVALDILEAIILTHAGSSEPFNPNEIDFEGYFGGTPCIVETYEDLKEILVLGDPKDDGSYPNITELPGVFDIARFIGAKKTWILLLLCSNNAGGTSYYIPEHLGLSCHNVLKSISLTAESWAA